MKLVVIMAGALSLLVACAPVKSPGRLANQEESEKNDASVNAGSATGDVSADNSGISAVNLSGRQVDLYAIRAGNAKIFLPPEFDKLPCAYFRQGPEFEIPPPPGGPPLALRGPVQNFYSGRWGRETEYSFKLSVYKRIYRDPGIPDWLPSPPTTRVKEYVLKLYDVVVSSPTSESCRISAVALN
jgi:hypothetical protein